MTASRRIRRSQIKLDIQLIQQLMRDKFKSLSSLDLDDKEILNQMNYQYQLMIHQQTREIEEGNENLSVLPDGYIEKKMINNCGPYYYLRCWSGKTRNSVYIGKLK